MSWTTALACIFGGLGVLWLALFTLHKLRDQDDAYAGETAALVAFVVWVFGVVIYTALR